MSRAPVAPRHLPPPDYHRGIHSFLLLKPDCLRLGLTRDAERAVARAGLRIVCRHRLRLTPADTRFLWSEYTDDGHVLARALLDRYLCGADSEVLTLRGPDAFEGARRAKRSLRSRHALGMFANVVHAAESRGELARQGNHLGGRCAICSEPFAAGEATTPVVRPTGHDFREGVDIGRLVEEVWPALQVDLVAPPPFRLDGGPADTGLFLGADREHSLDSSVTAVWRALPGVELAHALMLTLYAGRVGGYPIAVGPVGAVRAAHRVLVEHGFRVCGVEPLAG